jgi:uncharacterized membrane protein required for colicin V production
MYWTIYAIVLFAGLAMMVREGLWSNALALINIVISGLVAFGFYMPLVIYLDEMTDGKHTYWLDFAVIWALFVVTMLVCRAAAGAASKTRMRFKNPIDPVGGPVAGLIAAWVLAAFTLATLHVSPMPPDQFNAKLLYTDVSTAPLMTSPDAAWLGFVEKMSQPTAFGSGATTRFTANDFLEIYRARREKFDKSDKLVVPRG